MSLSRWDRACFARAVEYGIGATAAVRHCTRRGAKYVVGLELGGTRIDESPSRDGAPEDYYELLQISPTAAGPVCDPPLRWMIMVVVV